MDIIYLSETYLDSSIQSDNDNLEIPVYNLVCSDNPLNNTLRGESFAGRKFHECINFRE